MNRGTESIAVLEHTYVQAIIRALSAEQETTDLRMVLLFKGRLSPKNLTRLSAARRLLRAERAKIETIGLRLGRPTRL
jgi:hypothetical protein